MAELTSTRRRLLGAIALAPLAISVPAVAAASDLSVKLAAFAATDHRGAEHSRRIYEPAYETYHRLVAAIPHEIVRWKASPGAAGETWSTEDSNRIAEARYFLDARHTAPVRAEQAAYHRACIEVVAAADRRAVAVHQAAEASGINPAVEEDDLLNDLRTEAIDAVVACPVSTAKDLARKLAFINDHGVWEDEITRTAVSADVGRLAGVLN